MTNDGTGGSGPGNGGVDGSGNGPETGGEGCRSDQTAPERVQGRFEVVGPVETPAIASRERKKTGPKGANKVGGRVLALQSADAARELASRMHRIDPDGPTLAWWEWYLGELHARARKMNREGVIALKMIGDLACVEIRAQRALPAAGLPGAPGGPAFAEIRARQSVTVRILGSEEARRAAGTLARELAEPLGLAPRT